MNANLSDSIFYPPGTTGLLLVWLVLSVFLRGHSPEQLAQFSLGVPSRCDGLRRLIDQEFASAGAKTLDGFGDGVGRKTEFGGQRVVLARLDFAGKKRSEACEEVRVAVLRLFGLEAN